MLFPMINVSCVYISTSRSMCAVSNVAVFCSSLIAFQVCCWDTLCMTLEWFHLTLLLLVTLLFLYSTWVLLLLYDFYIFSLFLHNTCNSWNYKVYYQTYSFFIITDYNAQFIFRYGSVSFSLVYSELWLPYIHDCFYWFVYIYYYYDVIGY
jgi:hypothetical protein